MAKFKPGEPARIRRIYERKIQPSAQRYCGRECVVDEVSPDSAIPNETFYGETFYAIRVEGLSQRLIVGESGLEKLTGSWDEIERTTGFRPGRSKKSQREPVTAEAI